MNKIDEKEKLFKKNLKHPLINEIRGRGLMLALILKDKEVANNLVIKCLEKGLILFYLLFESKAVRITPPLTIKKNEIKLGCQIIINTLNQMDNSVH